MNRKNSTLKPAIKLQCAHARHVFSRKDKTFGIERLLRAFLVILPFIYPTLYVRHFAGKKGVVWRKTAVEVFVAAKVFFLIGLLKFTNSPSWAAILSAYLLSETVTYLLAIIFLSDIYSPPISRPRSFILLFINYFELNIGFSIIYLWLGGITRLTSKIDALYFSFVSFTTLGYGEMYPTIWRAKIAVIIQLMVMLLFVFLFFINLTPGMRNANKWLHKDR